MALSFAAILPMQSFAGDPAIIEIIQGEVINNDDDNKWDELQFTVKTKNGKIAVPVKRINVSKLDGNKVFEVPFEKTEINKKIDDYVVDLNGCNLTGDFFLELVLDLSSLDPDDYIVDGAPGPGPNETVIVIKYP